MGSALRSRLIWSALAVSLGVPIIAAAFSPLLAWRDPVYILAGFSGILAFVLMLVQPLLVAGFLPGLTARTARLSHKVIGATLVSAVVMHVIALWITSPPDVVDALLFVSPTPFSIWGVIAMWALFAAAFLAATRRSLRLRWSAWRIGHVTLVSVAVSGTVAHALLIEGTMEITSKVVLCALVSLALVRAIIALRSRRTGAHRDV